MSRARPASLALAVAGIAVGTAAIAAAPAPGERILSPSLAVLESLVSCGLYRDVASWAAGRGYRLPPGEGICRRGADSPAVALGWDTAAVWANAWSERSGRVPVYRDRNRAVLRDATVLGVVPTADASANGYRLPTLAELGLPGVRALMTRDIQEWSASRIDLGDGRPYYYLCRPGACDFHSSGMSGRGVGFRLVRRTAGGP